MELQLFRDPRQSNSLDSKMVTLDLWRIHLEQCPDCGHGLSADGHEQNKN